MVSSLLNQVRRAVTKEFSAYGCCEEETIQESILLKNSHYSGHRFLFGDWSAIWELDADVITVLKNGQQTKTISLPNGGIQKSQQAA